MIRIAGIIEESIVDGPGVRTSIFVQGCLHNCEGCHNQHTHDFNGGYDTETDEIIEKLAKNSLVRGITISGGEPFEQAENLIDLAKKTHEIGKTVIVYSGYTFDELMKNSVKNENIRILLENCDILIDGKFILSQKTLELKFRGSKNQRIIDLKQTFLQNKIILADYN